MRKLFALLITAIVLTVTTSSCEKMSKGCYTCHVNATGDDTEVQCGLTPGQAEKMEKSNGWTCYKVD